MKKSKQLKYEIRQRIKEERGIYARKRHKKYLWFKVRRLINLYFTRKLKPEKIKPTMVLKLSFWQRVVNWFKKLFRVLKNHYVKEK